MRAPGSRANAEWLPLPAERARELVATGRREPRTLTALLRHQLEAGPDRACLVTASATVTYAELDHRAERCAAGLRALGLRRGDRMLLCVGNRAEHVVAFYGALRAGIVPVLVLPALGDAEIRAVAVTATARLALLATRHGRRDLRPVAAALARLDHVTHVLSCDGGPDITMPPELDADPGPPRDDADVEDLALLTLSGGTTGTPKLIPRAHADYGYNALASARAARVGPGSVYLAVLPVAHNFTMVSPGIVGVLSRGGTVALCPDPSPTTAFELVERARVTITSLVPALVAPWLDEAGRTRRDLSSLRVLQVGGARLDETTARRVTPELGCALQQVFGMAEGLNCYTDLDGDPDVVCTTQGRPVCPDDEVQVVDEEDRPVPDGLPGELLTRGPYTIRGYYRARALDTVRFTPEGHFRTGDLVVRSPRGDLTVVGRVTDVVNRAGEKIAATEVEEHLLAHPGVRAAAVVAAPDPHLGERVVAFLVVTGVPPGRAQLRATMLARGAAAFAVPDEARTVPALPVTAVGKVDKRELRAWAGR